MSLEWWIYYTKQCTFMSVYQFTFQYLLHTYCNQHDQRKAGYASSEQYWCMLARNIDEQRWWNTYGSGIVRCLKLLYCYYCTCISCMVIIVFVYQCLLSGNKSNWTAASDKFGATETCHRLTDSLLSVAVYHFCYRLLLLLPSGSMDW